MPFRNVVVGAWSYDTILNSNVPWANRLPLLDAAVRALVAYRDQLAGAAATGNDVKTKTLWANPTGRLSMIFAAPEYMFMAPCASGLSNTSDERFLDETANTQILTALQGISERYGAQLLFVPGSIAYKKPFLKANDCSEDIAARYAKVQQRLDLGAAQIESVYTKAGYTVDRNFARAQPLSSPMSGQAARTTDDKLSMLRKGANNRFRDTFLGLNKMYMYHRGKVIATYRKKCDFHEVLPGYTQRTIFVPGYKSGRATVAGIPLGLEICLDHGTGVLADTGSATGDLPFIHMLASAFVSIEPGNVRVRNGGYVIHASSEESVNGAWRVTPGGVQRVANQPINVGNGVLHVGEMELNFP